MTTLLVGAGFKTILNGVSVTSPVSEPLTAFDPPPSNLDTNKLPAAYFWAGAATYDVNPEKYGADFVGSNRSFSVRVAIEPEGQGTPQSREARARAWIDKVRDTLFRYPSIGGVAGVQEMTPLSDSGLIILPEYDGKYIGFSFEVSVYEIIARTYAAGE